jgi:hypothetical protein
MSAPEASAVHFLTRRFTLSTGSYVRANERATPQWSVLLICRNPIVGASKGEFGNARHVLDAEFLKMDEPRKYEAKLQVPEIKRLGQGISGEFADRLTYQSTTTKAQIATVRRPT